MTAAIPQMRDQFRAHLAWIDAQLCDERIWLAGDAPSLLDINAYMNVWYARGNMPDADELFAEFDHARAWAGRVRGIGHGDRTEMTTAEALEIAAKAAPETEELSDPNDPERPQARRQGRGDARRLRQDPRRRRDRRAVATAHRDPPP